jgi:FkbM family methyltransferase
MKRFLVDWLFSAYQWIFARRWFVRWNRLLFQLSLRGLGVLNWGDDRLTGEKDFLRRFVKRRGPLIILDVGANEGQYAKTLKALDASCEIYAFEPHPETYKRLSAESRRHGFTAINQACGSTPDRLTLYDYRDHPEGSQHASLHQGVIEHLHHGHAIALDVEVTTIDDFIAQRNLQHISLLKIDTEGHEFEVLLGARNAIDRGSIEVVHLEFNEMNVISRIFCRDFFELLKDYSFYRMLPDGLLPLGPYTAVTCELFAYQNLVAILRGHEGANV